MGGASYLQFLIVFWMVMQVDWAKGVAFVRDLWVEWFHRFLTFWLTVWLLMLAFIWWTRNNTCPLVNGNVLSFRQVLSQCWDMDIGLSCLFLVKYPLGICVLSAIWQNSVYVLCFMCSPMHPFAIFTLLYEMYGQLGFYLLLALHPSQSTKELLQVCFIICSNWTLSMMFLTWRRLSDFFFFLIVRLQLCSLLSNERTQARHVYPLIPPKLSTSVGWRSGGPEVALLMVEVMLFINAGIFFVGSMVII